MRKIRQIPAAEVWKYLQYESHVKVIDEDDVVHDLFVMPAIDAAGYVYDAVEGEREYIFFFTESDFE